MCSLNVLRHNSSFCLTFTGFIFRQATVLPRYTRIVDLPPRSTTSVYRMPKRSTWISLYLFFICQFHLTTSSYGASIYASLYLSSYMRMNEWYKAHLWMLLGNTAAGFSNWNDMMLFCICIWIACGVTSWNLLHHITHTIIFVLLKGFSFCCNANLCIFSIFLVLYCIYIEICMYCKIYTVQ